MEERTYVVLSKIAGKGATTRMNEAEVLELIQEVASEIDMYSILSPEDGSKIRLIKRLDNLQNNINIHIRPYDEDTSLTLIVNGIKMIATIRCSVTSRDIKIIKSLPL